MESRDMSGADGDSVVTSSGLGSTENACGGGAAVDGTHNRASTNNSCHTTHSSYNSAPVKAASTASLHTLSRPEELSMTATGRSSSPVETMPPRVSGTDPTSSTRFAQAARGSRTQTYRPDVSHNVVAAAPSADVRDTVEYRAAWDLELWKVVQADRFRKQLEKQKSIALADLNRAVRRREAELKAELAQRTQAVAAREEAVKTAEAQLAARQAKATEMERDVRRMRQQLLEAQQRVEDEVRAQVRLANDTIAHRARLLEERVKAAEAQAHRADERQRQAQQEYITLYEAFSRYRTQQLTTTAAAAAPNANSLLMVSSTGASSSLGPAMQLDQLRAQWDAEHQLQLERQEQRHKTELAAVQRRCREVEEQNTRLTAALARRREQLRHLKAAAAGATPANPAPTPTVDNAPQQKPASATAESAALGASPSTHSQDAAAREAVERIVRELHRLEMDRVSLVDGSCGAVRETDAVIVRMDARMRDLQRQLAAVQGSAAVVADGG
jgi:centrosomal protein CEP120